MDGSGLSMYHECIEQIMECTDEGEELLQALAAVGFSFQYDGRGALQTVTFRGSTFTSPTLARDVFIQMYWNYRSDNIQNIKLEN